MIIDISSATSIALLGLRIIVALVFLYNGLQHIKKPQEESAALGGSSSAVVILGLVEIIGGLSVAFGLWIQIGAILLILAMLGAIYKKIYTWKIGFFAKDDPGWHYDLLLLCANFLFLCNGGGNMVLMR